MPQPPESPTAFADYARFNISALAGVTGVADKIGEKRVDPQAAGAALLECSTAPPEWPPSGVDAAASVDYTSPPSRRADSPRTREAGVEGTEGTKGAELAAAAAFSAIGARYWYLLVLGAFTISTGLPVPDIWLPLVPGWPLTEVDTRARGLSQLLLPACACARARTRTSQAIPPLPNLSHSTSELHDSRPVGRRC